MLHSQYPNRHYFVRRRRSSRCRWGREVLRKARCTGREGAARHGLIAACALFLMPQAATVPYNIGRRSSIEWPCEQAARERWPDRTMPRARPHSRAAGDGGQPRFKCRASEENGASSRRQRTGYGGGCPAACGLAAVPASQLLRVVRPEAHPRLWQAPRGGIFCVCGNKFFAWALRPRGITR